MAVTLNKANLVLKDANGNIGKIEQLSSNDLAKIKTAMSDVALVVNQSNHKPIEATTTNKGVVQFATSADVVAGASNKVVTAEQLHNVTTITKATYDGAGQQINTTYIKGVTANNATITVTKGNGTTSTATINNVANATNATNATKAIQDKNGAQIDTTYLPLSGGKMSGNIYRNADNSTLALCGGTTAQKGASLHLNGKDRTDYSGEFHLVTSNSTNEYRLKGVPNGTLTWNNKNIVRSVNGVNADTSGNVQLGNVGAITGEIKWFAFNEAPNGYLVCNGAKVSRTTYANLFKVIGTTFGSGDGSTTFTLPNLIDKFVQGSATVGTDKSAGLPNITGLIDSPSRQAIGCFIRHIPENDPHHMIVIDTTSTYPLYSTLNFDASRSSLIYGKSTTVQPPALTLLPCIKY